MCLQQGNLTRGLIVTTPTLPLLLTRLFALSNILVCSFPNHNLKKADDRSIVALPDAHDFLTPPLCPIFFQNLAPDSPQSFFPPK